jgi:hypothetical protein
MSAISPVNPGSAALAGLLPSNSPGPLASALASPSVQDALKNASPQDLVDLSLQALQLQETSGLFGNGNASQSPASPGLALLQSLYGAGASQDADADSGTFSFLG